jgi:hypothetical protein
MIMKKLFSIMFAVVASMTASAQCNWPIYYNNLFQGIGSPEVTSDIQFVWDQTVYQDLAMGQDLVAKPGVKKVVARTNAVDVGPMEIVSEFYANGLIKSIDTGNGTAYTYHYDKKWHLQYITNKEGDIKVKYSYDSKGQLVSSFIDAMEYLYIYYTNGKLSQIRRKSDGMTFDVKDNMVVCQKWVDEQLPTQNYSYDQQGRIVEKSFMDWGGDDMCFFYEISYKYGPTSTMPVSIAQRMYDYDWDTGKKMGKPDVSSYMCTYERDLFGNWTTMKVSAGTARINLKVTRSFIYYTNDEVKKAVADMEAARNPNAGKAEKKEETLWEF